MKLSEMRELLATRGIHLTKSLGQNFLHDGNQRRRIVKAAELSKTDKVLEIGPGLGPLTELLLENACEVLAIEKDARLVDFLRERFNIGQAASCHPSGKISTGKMPSYACCTPTRRTFNCARPTSSEIQSETAGAARLARLEARGQSALLRRVADSRRTGAIAPAAGTDGRDAATRSCPAAHGQSRR